MPRKFTIHRRETLFQGYFRMERLHISHDKFSGGTVGPFTREVMERGHAVVVLPYDPVSDMVILIEQFRAGAMLAGDPQPWLIESVAGIIDAGEAPEQVARREAMEEAGCVISDLVHIQDCYSTPGCMSEQAKLYVGHATIETGSGVYGIDHEHEDIRTHAIPADEAFDWLLAGKIRSAMAVIVVQWLMLNRDELRERWLASP